MEGIATAMPEGRHYGERRGYFQKEGLGGGKRGGGEREGTNTARGIIDTR